MTKVLPIDDLRKRYSVADRFQRMRILYLLYHHPDEKNRSFDNPYEDFNDFLNLLAFSLSLEDIEIKAFMSEEVSREKILILREFLISDYLRLKSSIYKFSSAIFLYLERK